MTVLTDNRIPNPARHTAASLSRQQAAGTTPRTRAPLFSVSRERELKERAMH
jgi:hypothetical protein